MFKRLFSSSQAQKTFKTCRIDSTHESMAATPIVTLALKYFREEAERKRQAEVKVNVQINGNNNGNINININNSKEQKSRKNSKKEEFLMIITKKLRSQSQIGLIKILIVCHSILRHTIDQEFMDTIQEEFDKHILNDSYEDRQYLKTDLDLKSKKFLEIERKKFVQRHIISFYCQYLKKMIVSIQTYDFARDFNSGKYEKFSLPETVNKGFSILNLVNFMLQSQSTFNKMGRYYFEREEILKLFVMLLQDMNIYNAFIKDFIKISIRRHKDLDPAMMKHYYLFITEAQKSSDRLYEFYHNRYYYKKIKKMDIIPTFMTLQSEEFKKFMKMMKTYDSGLVSVVKSSKYINGVKSSKHMTEEPALNEDKTLEDMTENLTQILYKTQLYEINRKNYESVVHDFEDEDLTNTFNDLQKTYQQTTIKYKLKPKV